MPVLAGPDFIDITFWWQPRNVCASGGGLTLGRNILAPVTTNAIRIPTVRDGCLGNG